MLRDLLEISSFARYTLFPRPCLSPFQSSTLFPFACYFFTERVTGLLVLRPAQWIFSLRTHAPPPRCESDFEPARRCRESKFEAARRWRRGVVARSLPEVVRRHPLCARRHQLRQGRYTTAPLLPPNFPPPEQDGQNVPAHTRAGTPAPHISAHGDPRHN